MLELVKEIVLGKAEAGGGGSTINNEDMTITANGIYTASEGYTGIGTATVNVPQPTGTISITANGTADVNDYQYADVSVPQYEEKTVTNTTGSAVAKNDKVWVDGSNLTSYYDMANPNFSLVGSPTVTNGVARGFSTTNYITPKCAFQNAYSSSLTWEWRTKIRLTTLDVFNSIFGGEAGTYLPDMFVGTSNRIGMNLSSNGTSYNICELAMGTTYLSTDTDYWVKWGWTGTVYYIDLSTDGINYTREVSVNSTSFVYSYDYVNKPLRIGFRVGEYLRGSIDLKETVLSIKTTSFNYTWQGYNVLTTADTNTGVALEAIANNASGKVAIGEVGKKYGATINNFLGDVDANGVLQAPTGNNNLVLNGVKQFYNQAFEYRFVGNNSIKTFSCPDWDISTNANSYRVFNQCFWNSSSIEEAHFDKIETVNANETFTACFQSCINLTKVTFNALKTISGQFGSSVFYGTKVSTNPFPNLESLTGGQKNLYFTFAYCSYLTSISFDKLSLCNTNQTLQSCFSGCSNLTSISFPALKSTSFGSYTNQFNNMLAFVTGCTVHFPSNLQAVIGSWSDVTGGFGGTNTTVLFDLPATE